MYKSLGFSRIVLGREISIDQIRRIKDAVPDMELETFVHGAMCIAYAGRCLMSAYLTGRSAQSGFCSHTCRWNFKLAEDMKSANDSSAPHIITADEAKMMAQSGLLTIEEEQRPGEKFPIFEGEDFTAVLSLKDIRSEDRTEPGRLRLANTPGKGSTYNKIGKDYLHMVRRIYYVHVVLPFVYRNHYRLSSYKFPVLKIIRELIPYYCPNFDIKLLFV